MWVVTTAKYTLQPNVKFKAEVEYIKDLASAFPRLTAVLEATKVHLGVNSIISPQNVYHLQNLLKRLDNSPLNKTELYNRRV